MRPRRATATDVPAAVETLVLAFDSDPVWSDVFDDPETRSQRYRFLWTLFVTSSVRLGGTWMTDGAEAVSVWFPPGADELSAEQHTALDGFIERLPASESGQLRELMARFDAIQSADPPHHYLDLLGTHPDHRGKGWGMDLLRADLARIDELGEPAYLESTNPANLERYGSVGFTAIDTFEARDGGPVVTTMWRDPAVR